jgi:23S rRNA (cytidine1920-2'-O)/16S rRNA (cytidine1409-2'-O)-methyltransferase
VAEPVKPRRGGGARRERADKLAFEQGLASSRERAQALILAGSVLAGDRPVEKPGQLLPATTQLRLRGPDLPYVSRGGLKLAHAIESFGLAPAIQGATCVDVGASTGGFTDCLLSHGAARVYAVDVGYGQLAWKLREDPRVIAIERQNIRYLPETTIPERVDLATVDVSFISLELVLPRVAALVKPGGTIVALVKPQFEVGRGAVGKGGVVRDPAQRAAAVAKIEAFARTAGWQPAGVVESPIEGPAGNRELLLLLRV